MLIAAIPNKSWKRLSQPSPVARPPLSQALCLVSGDSGSVRPGSCVCTGSEVASCGWAGELAEAVGGTLVGISQTHAAVTTRTFEGLATPTFVLL